MWGDDHCSCKRCSCCGKLVNGFAPFYVGPIQIIPLPITTAPVPVWITSVPIMIDAAPSYYPYYQVFTTDNTK